MVNETLGGAVAPSGALQSDKETNMTDPNRPPRQTENENQRPAGDGEPPRPATEPGGSKGSSNSGETETDPATGTPNP